MTYALPMVAGALLIVPVIEFGTGTALTAYAAVALLSIFLAGDKEAALMYALLFGIYPIIKRYFEMLPRRLFEYIAKYAYFNAAAFGAIMLAYWVFGVPLDDGTLGRWFLPVLAVAGNICFIVYDIALTKIITLYVRRLQPQLRRAFKL